MKSRLLNSIALLVGLFALAACTSATVDQTLAPQPVASNVQPTENPQDIATANAEPSSVVGYASAESTPSPLTSQTAAIDPSQSIAFLPVEGAPQSTVSALNRSLRNSSQVHGLGLVPGNTTNAKYRVKGYFSALNDGTGTLLVYIWDVVDQNGNRIHRINGRERTGNASADPWQSITDQEISAVADTTAAKLKSWVEARS